MQVCDDFSGSDEDDENDIETFNYDKFSKEDDEYEYEWSATKPRRRKFAKDITQRASGLTEESKGIKTILDAFNLFITQDIKNIIVCWTNEKGTDVYEDWIKVNTDELDAFISILIVMGIVHDNKTRLCDLWSKDSLFHISFYKEVMTRKRFKQILRCMRFDDSRTRDERKKSDKLAAIREITEIFRNNCIKNYNEGNDVTIDERIVSFRGNCAFRVYMKNKPDSYGLKIWMMCDAKTFYVKNFQVYLGKQNNQRDKNQSQRVVLDLTQCLSKGSNVTTDNFFTSIPLAMKLLQRNITLVGTLRQNRKGIPHDMLSPIKTRNEYSTEFLFTDKLQLTSYCPKKGKVVMILSSSDPDTSITNSSDRNKKSSNSVDDKKPHIIHVYNKTKVGVDLFDNMTKIYSCKRTCRRWPQVMFYNIIDTALLNSFICIETKVRMEHEDLKLSRREGYLSLAKELSKPYVEKRRQRLVMPHEDTQIQVNRSLKRQRCSLCPPPVRSKKYAFQCCSMCDKLICKDHCVKVTVCRQCQNSVHE